MKITDVSLFYCCMGIILGIVCLGYYAPSDRRLLRLIESNIQHFIEKSYALKAKVTLEHVGFFTLRLKNIRLYDKEWSINIASLTMSYSKNSLQQKKLMLDCSIDGLLIRSTVQNNVPPIVHRLAVHTSDTPWYGLNTITIYNAVYSFEHVASKSSLKGIFNANLGVHNDEIILDCSYHAGQYWHYAQEHLQQLQGNAHVCLKLKTMQCEALLKGSLKMNCVPSAVSTWQYQARYLKGQGVVTFNTPDAALCIQITPIILSRTTQRAQIMSFVFLEKFLPLSSLLNLKGTIRTQAYLTMSPDKWHLQGSSILKEMTIAQKTPYDATAHFTLTTTELRAACLYRQHKDNRYYSYKLQGNPSKNLFFIDSDASLRCAIVTSNWWLPQSFFVLDKIKRVRLARIDLPANNFTQPIKAIVNYQLIGPFLEYYTKIRLLGNSIFNVSIQPTLDDCAIKLQSEGKIYFPIIYNFMHSLTADIKAIYASQTLHINKLHMLLEKGSIAIDNAYGVWQDQQLKLLHLPMSFSELFINQAKHAYAWLSGSIVLEKNKISTCIKGDISIDKSSFYANPFSKTLQKIVESFSNRSYNTHIPESSLAINIHTLQPTIIKTPFLRALIDTRLTLKGTTNFPIIAGVLSIRQGELLFGYKPLSLISGHITLLPHRHHDPLIEFIAQGTIRRYQVTIHCQGSVSNPQLYLSSIPSLNQEHIVMLLMTGSVEGNLGSVMPSLILNNLQALLFDEQQPSSAQRYLKTLLSPLRYVKFVPNFADQTARGGFRGSIEVDIGNNVRATLKKNFSLLEDTKIDVEYTLSDDITIRGLKDERGDLGGEIEMRFKF